MVIMYDIDTLTRVYTRDSVHTVYFVCEANTQLTKHEHEHKCGITVEYMCSARQKCVR